MARNGPAGSVTEFIGDEGLGGYIKVLAKTRDLIHLGHRLLTHPLSGSVKPGETPYKTVLLTSNKGKLDIESLEIIENSVITANKLIGRSKRVFNETLLQDFQLIDYQLIFSYING